MQKQFKTAHNSEQGHILASIIGLVFGVISLLLAARFLLVLLGANLYSGFGESIMLWSQPLVDPFYNLFPNAGNIFAGRIELPTVIAN